MSLPEPLKGLRTAPRALLVVFLLLALGCSREQARPLHVATNVWPGYEPIYLAQSLGYFSPGSVTLHEMPNASDVIMAFRNHAVEAAALTLDETFQLLQDGIDVRILMVLDVSNGADAVLARPGIDTLAGLKGKRVGVESSALGGYLLSRALDAARLKPEEITVLQAKVNEQEQSYLSGQVDAVVTFDPVRTRLLARGAKVLFDSKRIPDEIFDVLVVDAETCRVHADQVRELKLGWYRALAYLRANPANACRMMAKRERITPGEFRDALAGLSFPDAADDRRLLAGGLLPPARRLAQVMLEAKLLRHPVDPARLLAENGGSR